RVAAVFPRIYEALGAILAEKLMRADRRPMRAGRGRLSLLLDHGAPPLLGYALACSVAWHTRAATLLLIIREEEPPVSLAHLAERAAPRGDLPQPGGGSPPAGAGVVLARPDGPFAPASLAATLDDLGARYDHVLLQLPARLAATAPVSSRV